MARNPAIRPPSSRIGLTAASTSTSCPVFERLTNSPWRASPSSRRRHNGAPEREQLGGLIVRDVLWHRLPGGLLVRGPVYTVGAAPGQRGRGAPGAPDPEGPGRGRLGGDLGTRRRSEDPAEPGRIAEPATRAVV